MLYLLVINHGDGRDSLVVVSDWRSPDTAKEWALHEIEKWRQDHKTGWFSARLYPAQSPIEVGYRAE